jgi:hypothetical protein
MTFSLLVRTSCASGERGVALVRWLLLSEKRPKSHYHPGSRDSKDTNFHRKKGLTRPLVSCIFTGNAG